MSPTNITFLTGNLTRDPDYRTSPSGIVVCRFSVAANSRYRDKAGVWQKDVAFVPCVLFGKAADRLQNRKMGAALVVIGRLKSETWEKDGQRHWRLGLVAESVQISEGTTNRPDVGLQPQAADPETPPF